MKKVRLLTIYLASLALGAIALTSCGGGGGDDPDPIAVTGVTLNKTTLPLAPGAEETLIATVLPSDAANKTMTWTSSAATIATVDNTGKVKAVAVGTATITAKSTNGKTATCTVTVAAETIAVTSVTLDKDKTTLLVGGEETLTATVAPDNATNKTVTWTSSAINIATIANGKITAVAVGTATITATAGDKTATCEVTVSATSIDVISVSLNKPTISLNPGGSETLIATITPENATNQTITWSSSATGVATVDNTGKVTAVANGTATITATSHNSKTATCAVTVSAAIIPVSSVILNNPTLTLNVGTTETLTATVAPANATDKTVTWESSASHVASVDATGKVTAVAGGTATITATAGGKSATCEVTVTVPVIGITLNKPTMALTMGGNETLTATIAPANATVKTVTWTSSNSSIAAVDNTGKVIAQAAGTATITATSNNGKTATCAVTVSSSVIAVTGVTLDKTTLSLVAGTNATLTATVTPANATDKTVTWSSDKPDIATVDNTGKVTAIAAGSAIITAKAGDKIATCAVTVTAATVPVAGITVDKPTLSLVAGTNEILTATVTPANATDKTVTWTSSATGVATVDNTGKVTAVTVGTATITATSNNGKTATCALTVTATSHPTQGKITLTSNWANVAAGIAKSYTVSVVGQHTATYSGDVNTLTETFDPGTYQGLAYNAAAGITVSGTVATVGTTRSTVISSNPGWLFTAYEPNVVIEKDKVHQYTAVMQQQVRELTITLKPEGGSANHISGMSATLGGITASWDFATNQPTGAAASVAPVFTKQGDGTWKATVRLLGTNGASQKLSLTITYNGGSPSAQTIECDLSGKLTTFNALADAKTPLDMSATIIEVPTGAGFKYSLTEWIAITRPGGIAD